MVKLSIIVSIKPVLVLFWAKKELLENISDDSVASMLVELPVVSYSITMGHFNNDWHYLQGLKEVVQRPVQ